MNQKKITRPDEYAGKLMTSFDHVMILTRGNRFQTNPLEHKLDDLAGDTVYSVCVTDGKDIWHFNGNFDHHFSLYCGSVKPKFKTRPG